MRWSTSIRAVALFEASKGLLVVIAGFGILSLAGRDVEKIAERLVRHLHLNAASHYPKIFLDAVSRVNDWGLWKLALLAALYAAVRFVEAYGLWRQRHWAEWFAALSGAIYIPFEIRGVMRGHGPTAIAALVINVAIVAVMLFALYRSYKLRHALP
jgi:uncharacterized membrane protein (DUF2068 family)